MGVVTVLGGFAAYIFCDNMSLNHTRSPKLSITAQFRDVSVGNVQLSLERYSTSEAAEGSEREDARRASAEGTEW